jgi:hypothetical protein
MDILQKNFRDFVVQNGTGYKSRRKSDKPQTQAHMISAQGRWQKWQA